MSNFLPEPDYEDDPATITVEVQGEELPWYLGAKSFKLAREKKDLEPDDILVDVDPDKPIATGIQRVSRLVWAGWLVFDEDLSIEDVKALISFPPPDGLMNPITERLDQMPDDQTQGLGKDQAAS